MDIELGNSTRAKIISAVFGQLSDGKWENSGAMTKYWRFGEVHGTTLEVGTSDPRSGFYQKSEDWIKNWFASKLKAVVQDEFGNNKEGWRRDNTAISEYISYHHDVTVADCYECYDFLKGRHGHSYGSSDSSTMTEAEVKNKFTKLFRESFIVASKDTLNLTIALNNTIEELADIVYEELKVLLLNTFDIEEFHTLQNNKTVQNMEISQVRWPNDIEAERIFRNNPIGDNYYNTITKELDLDPNSTSDCLLAEYLTPDIGIRDSIFSDIEKVYNKN